MHNTKAYSAIQNLQSFRQQSIFFLRMRILTTEVCLPMLLLKCILNADASDTSPSENSPDRETEGQVLYRYKPTNKKTQVAGRIT